MGKHNEYYFDGKYKGELHPWMNRLQGKWEFIHILTNRECKLESIEITHVGEGPDGRFCHWIRTWGLDSYCVISESNDPVKMLELLKRG